MSSKRKGISEKDLDMHQHDSRIDLLLHDYSYKLDPNGRLLRGGVAVTELRLP